LDGDTADSHGSRRQALEVLETRRGCLPVSTEVLPDNEDKQGFKIKDAYKRTATRVIVSIFYLYKFVIW
jgi:hypothetical protein